MNRRPSRMEQIGNLLTAMIAVIVSGSSELLVVSPESKNKFESGGIYSGVFKRVAAELKLSSTYVRQVYRGKYDSARISEALAIEIRKCDEEAGKSPEPQPLTRQELAEFARGRKYFGVYSCAALKLGISRTTANMVARGSRVSRKTLLAIRAEMQRIDAALLEKDGRA